jgi:hypothetical protein
VSWDFVDANGRTILDWHRLSARQLRDECWYDLAEISAVPVPGDPRALQLARQARQPEVDSAVNEVIRQVLLEHLVRPPVCGALGQPKFTRPDMT